MILVSNCPALPTNGSPCASSSAPGASPTNIRSASGLPTPKTVWVREFARCGHLTHAQTRSLMLARVLALSWEGCARGANAGKGRLSRAGGESSATIGLLDPAPVSAAGRFRISRADRDAHGGRALSLRIRSRVSKTVSSACGNCITRILKSFARFGKYFDAEFQKTTKSHQ